jgi:hypothetical protein
MSNNRNKAGSPVAPRNAEVEQEERDAAKGQIEAELAAAAGDDDDPRDAEIAALRAAIDAARNPERELDAKDRAMAELRAELAGINSTPAGREAELEKSLKALQEQVERMARGEGLIPVPQSGKPDPLLYGMVLATGEVIEVSHPHATMHHSPEHKIDVPVTGYFTLAPEMRERANA